ncbi:MAG: hypothetical protein JWN99_1732 [Ilumatobacteraceae bacterium]|nr:hypothetical protein [Ilumatobacteraceae bacterium]
MTSSHDPRSRAGASAQRVSRRRYRQRRVGALVVLMLVGAGIAKVGGALFGADGTVADGGSTTTLPAVPASEPVTDGSVAPDSAAIEGASTTSTTTAPPANASVAGHVPTTADPARVLIAGDSDAGTFGPYLEKLLKETGVVTSQLEYEVSTGLARPDALDWPAKFRTLIPTVNPDIVIVTFGGNDAQGLAEASGNFIVQQPTGEPGGDVEWRAEYGKRVGALMDYLSADGRTLIWVGIPNDDSPADTARLKVQDETVRAEVAKRPNVKFIDTWKRFSGRDGNWAEYVIDPRDGQGKDVRAADGFHLNVAGAEILALDINDVVRQELHNRGASF